jgi:hypothetical protein
MKLHIKNHRFSVTHAYVISQLYVIDHNKKKSTKTVEKTLAENSSELLVAPWPSSKNKSQVLQQPNNKTQKSVQTTIEWADKRKLGIN